MGASIVTESRVAASFVAVVEDVRVSGVLVFRGLHS